MWGREEGPGDGSGGEEEEEQTGEAPGSEVAPEMPLGGWGVGRPMPVGDRERGDGRTQNGGAEEQKGGRAARQGVTGD